MLSSGTFQHDGVSFQSKRHERSVMIHLRNCATTALTLGLPLVLSAFFAITGLLVSGVMFSVALLGFLVVSLAVTGSQGDVSERAESMQRRLWS